MKKISIIERGRYQEILRKLGGKGVFNINGQNEKRKMEREKEIEERDRDSRRLLIPFCKIFDANCVQ